MVSNLQDLVGVFVYLVTEVPFRRYITKATSKFSKNQLFKRSRDVVDPVNTSGVK